MPYSRRELGALVAAAAGASGLGAQNGKLASRIWLYDELPVQTDGPNRMRQVFQGETHSGFLLEAHETDLPPGGAPHPPHHHVHEEMIAIREGAMEVTISGRSARLGPGSVAYVASGEEHGWRNVGDTRARYLVLAFGRDA